MIGTDRRKTREWAWCLLLPMAMVVAATGVCSATPLTAQEKEAAKADESKPARKKARGRLPMYFGKVVTQQQREDIYEIQARFAVQIEQLRKQMEELIRKRDAEVESVLTAEQLAEVKKLKAEAKKRRMAGRRKSSAGTSK